LYGSVIYSDAYFYYGLVMPTYQIHYFLDAYELD